MGISPEMKQLRYDIQRPNKGNADVVRHSMSFAFALSFEKPYLKDRNMIFNPNGLPFRVFTLNEASSFLNACHIVYINS